MAKETAHQIGTPLSSLIGWNELLKNENINPDYVQEINNDIQRLETITERFSKIGSVPQLEPTDAVQATKSAIEYLQSRSSALVNFEARASFAFYNTKAEIDQLVTALKRAKAMLC